MKYIILFFFIISCSDAPITKPRNIEEYYQDSGILNYYLSEVPLWASFSTGGKCFHNQSATYLNLQKIQDSFGLTFSESLQFQLQLNLVRNFEHKSLKIEEQFFYDSLEKIRAKFYPFMTNEFDSVNVVWLEGYNEEDLKKIIYSKYLNSAPVVFLSLCLNNKEFNKKLESYNLPYQYQILSIETLTIYEENKAMPFWQIPLRDWLGAKKKIIFFSKNNIPSEIQDEVILQNK